MTGVESDSVDYGSRTLYAFGVKNGTVSELSRIIRYYSDRECGKNPSMIITTVYSLHVVADP